MEYIGTVETVAQHELRSATERGRKGRKRTKKESTIFYAGNMQRSRSFTRRK
jgi:hypothetical protein